MTDDERDARIETLTDAIAETNRVLREQITATNQEIAATNQEIAATNRNVAALTADVSSLARLMRAHLVHDHGYPEIDDDDSQ